MSWALLRFVTGFTKVCQNLQESSEKGIGKGPRIAKESSDLWLAMCNFLLDICKCRNVCKPTTLAFQRFIWIIWHLVTGVTSQYLANT